MNVLVAIANFGTKNQRYLERLLHEYRSMTRYKIHVVVLSNIPKALGSDVEVLVGLPIKDPWSLPFAHKSLFISRADQFDIFIYSEDDTLVTEQSIDAFMQASSVLPADRIAGFMRYEVGPTGQKYCSTIHGRYHWDPNSIEKHGGLTFAYYTNEHAACYMLTQYQLKSTIASDGFQAPPRKGTYDMLVTAATDPYTQCGMKKLICLSRFDDFCLHHLPNVYCGKIGVPFENAVAEVEELQNLPEENAMRGPLFRTVISLHEGPWSKQYYEPPRSMVTSMIPPEAKSILSIGCTSGETEALLIANGLTVTGIPMDCVIALTAKRRGIDVMPPTFSEASVALEGRKFDCIIFLNVLQHSPKPIELIKRVLRYLAPDGRIVAVVPNFGRLPVVRDRILRRHGFCHNTANDGFRCYGIHLTTIHLLQEWIRASGLNARSWHYARSQSKNFLLKIASDLCPSHFSREIGFTAIRSSPTETDRPARRRRKIRKSELSQK